MIDSKKYVEDTGAILNDKLRAKNCKVIFQSDVSYILKMFISDWWGGENERRRRQDVQFTIKWHSEDNVKW